MFKRALRIFGRARYSNEIDGPVASSEPASTVSVQSDEFSKSEVESDQIQHETSVDAIQTKGQSPEVSEPSPFVYPDGVLCDGRWVRSRTQPLFHVNGLMPVEVPLWESNSFLISGNSGSGKSALLRNMVLHVLEHASPEEARLILIDAVGVGFAPFRGIPHLVTDVITDQRKVGNALGWLVREIDTRYELLVKYSCRDFSSLRAKLDGLPLHVPSEIIVFIDDLDIGRGEIADDISDSLHRALSRGGRVDVRIVMAASLGTVHLLPSFVREQFECRISFRTTSACDFHLVLGDSDSVPALGPWQLAMLKAASGGLQRYTLRPYGEDRGERIVSSWLAQVPTARLSLDVEPLGTSAVETKFEDSDESMIRAAIELVVMSQLGSTGMLQRKLRVGFARAGRIMEILEELGVVGPANGSRARDVLLTIDEWRELTQ